MGDRVIHGNAIVGALMMRGTAAAAKSERAHSFLVDMLVSMLGNISLHGKPSMHSLFRSSAEM
jgi:hypothetical protein